MPRLKSAAVKTKESRMSDKNDQKNIPANLTLNDAAAFLVQIEPDDLSELIIMKEMLIRLADNRSYPDICRKKIGRAAKKIEENIRLTASDPAAANTDLLTQAGHLIEEAMNTTEADDFPSAPEDTVPDQEESVSAGPSRDAPVPPEPAPLSRNTVEKNIPAADAAEVNSVTGGYDDEDEDSATSEADPDLLAAFITESSDLILNAEESLLLLETEPGSMDAVSTVFRAFHTVKGTSAFLELSLISELAHHAESFLTRIRDHEIRYAGGYTDLALRSIDILKELIRSVQDVADGRPFVKPPDYDRFMQILIDPEKAGINDTESAPPELFFRLDETADIRPDVPEKSDQQPLDPFRDEAAISESDTEDTGEDDLPEDTRESISGEDTDSTPRIIADRGKPETYGKLSGSAAGVHASARPGYAAPSRISKHFIESSIRVPINRLDRFIDMVGELVVAHSMVAQDEAVSDGTHHELMKKVVLTGKIVRELQNMSMSMRMIPLKSTFQKMTRLVRDLARKAGKKVTLLTEGEDTEIDRNMVDIINDPLVHMVRNAVDHGIEMPDVRESQGKDPYGTVRLSARHSAGNVAVEIRDDGKGLDREAIIAKAVETGFISESEKNRVFGDRELFNLIFEPGFSTAKVVSEVSGRGVGMNVVKTNIEALRGQIEIQSSAGKGSTFRMSLPLTLAIIDGMVVRVGEEKYVMPTCAIVRSVRPSSKDITTVFRKGEMLILQGKLIPLFRLADMFRIPGAEKDPVRAIVMVVEDSGQYAGILIDELIGSQQIVIKTLGESLRNIPGISGSAIMPNGRVGLILDVGGLVKLANTGEGDRR